MMKTAKTATEAKMPPTRKFAVCWNSPSSEAADHGAAVVAHAAQRHRDETVESQHRPIAEKGQQHLAAGEAGQRADHAGERIARHAQAAFRQAERARRIGVLGDRQEGAADQRVAIEQFEADDHDGAGQHRQPELLVEAAAGDRRSRRGNGCASVPHSMAVNCCTISAQRQRREHVEMLVEAFEHRPHGDDLGDDAEHGAAGQHEEEADRHRQAQARR